MRREVAIALVMLFVAQSPSAAGSYYSVTGGGAQFWIGDERPLPLQPQRTSLGGPIGTRTMFPPLLIPVNPNPAEALVQQTAGPDPKQITIPPGALYRKAPGIHALGAANLNPRLLELRTNIEFSGPAPALGDAVLKAGGRTGPPVVTFLGQQGGGARYVRTAAQFGGPLQFRMKAATPIREFVFQPQFGGMLPCKHPLFGGMNSSCLVQLLAQYPGSLAVFGAKVGFTTMTPGTPAPMSPNVVAASIPNTTGLIAKTVSVKQTGTRTDMASSSGFPWTTGKVLVSSPSALAVYERFTITGMDSRMNGVGTLSLVSGAISNRTFTGPNASRGWLRLTVPEPGASIAAFVALTILMTCHVATRSRARRR